MDDLNAWLNITVLLVLVGAAVWASLLPSTTFFGDDD
jgi:hypothetical protein